jgi:hypothetical protein
MVHAVVLCELHEVIRCRPDFGDAQFRRVVDAVEPKIVQKTPGHLMIRAPPCWSRCRCSAPQGPVARHAQASIPGRRSGHFQRLVCPQPHRDAGRGRLLVGVETLTMFRGHHAPLRGKLIKHAGPQESPRCELALVAAVKRPAARVDQVLQDRLGVRLIADEDRSRLASPAGRSLGRGKREPRSGSARRSRLVQSARLMAVATPAYPDAGSPRDPTFDWQLGGNIPVFGRGAARRDAGTPKIRASVVVSCDPRRRGNDNPAGLRKQETG